MTFNQRLKKLQESYNCRFVNRGTPKLAIEHEGVEYPLLPECRTIQPVWLTAFPQPLKHFIESVVDLQEEMGFAIN